MAGPYTLNGGSVDDVYKKYKDQIAVATNGKGEAHCALLVQKLTGAPLQETWKRGDPVKGSNITAGTAIACFDGEKYTGVSGICHAAIYIPQTAKCIEVWDQWADGHVGQRKADGYRHGQRPLWFRTEKEKGSPNYRPVNDGTNYYVIS